LLLGATDDNGPSDAAASDAHDVAAARDGESAGRPADEPSVDPDAMPGA
jgi:hypothetical protein